MAQRKAQRKQQKLQDSHVNTNENLKNVVSNTLTVPISLVHWTTEKWSFVICSMHIEGVNSVELAE